MRRACIDIGSNTTRLLVADCDAERLAEVRQDRVFTRIGLAVGADGSIAAAKIEEVAAVVAAQFAQALSCGAREVFAVATAAIRRAANQAELVEAIAGRCGLAVAVLSGEDEARLAFLGAAGTLGHIPDGPLGVVDVGGGSSEVVVGIAPRQVTWSASFPLGSGDLAERCLHSDPPAADELDAARARARAALAGIDVPVPAEAVSVGGSATSLRRLAGATLDRDAFARTLGLLGSRPASAVARQLGLDIERVRLLPAGLLILEAVGERFGIPLQIARGGVREGVLLEAGG